MKKVHLLITSCVLCAFVGNCLTVWGQSAASEELRKLEEMERKAILEGDTVVLRQLLSSKIVVHNPDNTVINFDQIMSRVGAGKIDYASFERTIEQISFVENIAIVAGEEVVEPRGLTSHQGKTVTRRFTNIWIYTNGIWKLTARQSTIVSVK